MVFNPSKCYIMSVGKGRTHKPHFYELFGIVLNSVDQERYLGVILSQDMTWNPHISYITSKANQKLGFIKRILKGNPQELRCLDYISLVRSGMEYVSTVCDPHLSKDKDSMERVQRRAAHWIIFCVPSRASRCLLIMNIDSARCTGCCRRKACMGWS